MAYSGQTITNPVSGETITFRKTAADTNGEYLEIDLELTPDGAVPGIHVHPHQEERFEVISGRMKFQKGFKKVEAGPGETVTVEPGTAHKFENAGDEKAYVRVTVTPALKMEELFETTVQLAEEGRTNKKGMPKPMDFALFVTEYRDEVVGPFPPAWMQRAAIAPLAALARRRGRGERYSAPRPAIA